MTSITKVLDSEAWVHLNLWYVWILG